jgi:hypothetical protein
MSVKYANGSTSWCLHVPVKEYRTAAVRPPRPLNVRERLPDRHMPRTIIEGADCDEFNVEPRLEASDNAASLVVGNPFRPRIASTPRPSDEPVLDD